jgi:hypothetical protein
MKTNSIPLERLMARARQTLAASESDGAEIFMPPGFATRVVALAALGANPNAWLSMLERRAWQALGVAVGVACLSVVLNFQPISKAIQDDVLAGQDPVTALLDLS